LFLTSYITGLALIIPLAYLLDLAIGDPLWLPHPIRWIGRLIEVLEIALRREAFSPGLLRALGLVLTLIVVVLVYALSLALLFFCFSLSTPLGFFVAVLMGWATLSARGLATAAYAVQRLLRRGNIKEARIELSCIVGRDTNELNADEIERALVETISENTSDGIVAPLFFMALGGPPLALAYKAINTLDSMLGYKNEKYLYFGWFPARTDDIANYIPARITAFIMVVASFILGFDWRSSARVLVRDGSAHPSPNAGLPEAAMAGAIGVTLGGASTYKESVVEKPVIGDGLIDHNPAVVASTVRIMHLTGIIMAIAVVLFTYFN
jgi:adenosylcobinamide-phosphate synthase